MPEPTNALSLAQALTRRADQLCLGIEDGDADILELVTPTTASCGASCGFDSAGWPCAADAVGHTRPMG